MYSRWDTLTNSIALCLIWFCFTLTLGSYSYLLFFPHLFSFHLQLQLMTSKFQSGDKQLM